MFVSKAYIMHDYCIPQKHRRFNCNNNFKWLLANFHAKNKMHSLYTKKKWNFKLFKADIDFHDVSGTAVNAHAIFFGNALPLYTTILSLRYSVGAGCGEANGADALIFKYFCKISKIKVKST